MKHRTNHHLGPGFAVQSNRRYWREPLPPQTAAWLLIIFIIAAAAIALGVVIGKAGSSSDRAAEHGVSIRLGPPIMSSPIAAPFLF